MISVGTASRTRAAVVVGLNSAIDRVSLPGVGYFGQSLPDDAVGNFDLTLTNLVVGSAVEVQTQVTGTSLYNGIASTSSLAITLSAYTSGSGNDNNNLRIKVRKGSASPYYQPFETLTTAFVGSQSIYVSQISDE